MTHWLVTMVTGELFGGFRPNFPIKKVHYCARTLIWWQREKRFCHLKFNLMIQSESSNQTQRRTSVRPGFNKREAFRSVLDRHRQLRLIILFNKHFLRPNEGRFCINVAFQDRWMRKRTGEESWTCWKFLMGSCDSALCSLIHLRGGMVLIFNPT